jgi:hypothetical protein
MGAAAADRTMSQVYMHDRVQGWNRRLAAACVAAMLITSSQWAAPAEPAAVTAKPSDKQPGVDLLAADSRNDWIHKQAGAAGWTVADGASSGSTPAAIALNGGAKSTPLVSTYALGDFELRIDWKVADGAALTLGFPLAAAGAKKSQAVEIHLAEQPGISIRLPEGAKILKVNPQLKGKTHRTIIKRVGDQLVLDCDGTKSRELAIAANEKFGLTLAIDSAAADGSVAIEALRLIEKSEPNLSKP